MVNRPIEDLKHLAEWTAAALRKHPDAPGVRLYYRCALASTGHHDRVRHMDMAEQIIEGMLGHKAPTRPVYF
jgi:hypothetical protein